MSRAAVAPTEASIPLQAIVILKLIDPRRGLGIEDKTTTLFRLSEMSLLALLRRDQSK